jgi:hypothetical protein
MKNYNRNQVLIPEGECSGMRILISFCLIIIFACISAAVEDKSSLDTSLHEWKPDYYRALVVYDAKNPAITDEGVNAILAKSEDNIKSLNLSIRKIDLADKANIDAKTAEVLKVMKPGKFPFTIIYFPENSEFENPLWAGNMSTEEADMIADSPARREIVRRLLKGESAVWLLIESGVDYKDYRILKLLSEEIKNIGDKPASGDIVPVEVADLKKGKDKQKPPTKMSIIRISRDDVAEKFLLKLLNDIEPDIMNVENEPVLVPVYEKGRILKLFSNAEITGDNIRNAIELFTDGNIEMERVLNPGTALPLSVNWDAFASGKLSIDKELPALRNFNDKFVLDDVFPGENRVVPDMKSGAGSADNEKTASVRTPFPMRIINIVLVSVIGLLVVLFFAVVLRSRK